MTLTDPAWCQTEPSDTNEPSLIDRLYTMPANAVVSIIADLMEEEPLAWEWMQDGIEEYEAQQMEGVTP